MSLYTILEITIDASDAEVRTAYRRLVMKVHPDRNPNDPTSPEKFRAVTHAFETLMDAAKRRLYDEFGDDATRKGFDPVVERERRSHLSALQQRAGALGKVDLVGELVLGPSEAARGGKRTVILSSGGPCAACVAHGYVQAVCVSCSGYGLMQQQTAIPCGVCGGVGRVVVQPSICCATCQGGGVLLLGATLYFCPTCGGAGRTLARPQVRGCHDCSGAGVLATYGLYSCASCNGAGAVIRACGRCMGRGNSLEQQKLIVTIPPGLEEGKELRLIGKGVPSETGGSPGDLYLRVSVR